MNSFFQEYNQNLDPTGIVYLSDHPIYGKNWNRHAESPLREIVAKLVTGEITAEDIPAYEFASPVDEQTKGYSKFFSGWKNIPQPSKDKVLERAI